MGKKITREQVEEVSELVNQWVAENMEPGSDVIVITTEKCKDGTSKVVASNTVGGLSVLWDDADFLSGEATTKLTIYDLVRPVTLETKPELVNLSDMWHWFETRNYLTQKIREELETAVSTGKRLSTELWVILPGINTPMCFPADYPRRFLENVFLAHVYSHLKVVTKEDKGVSPLKTKGVNRPEITGLSKVPRVVRAGDGELACDVLKAVALELITRGVKIGDSYRHSDLERVATDVTNRYWG
mgnify:CR=1 FL=1|jgi:hypothetical protein